MPKRSAGLLMFRRTHGELEVFLVHPGGPFWVKKDAAAWTLPKGQYEEDEEPLAAAQREFHEETGFLSAPPFLLLGDVKQKSGKVTSAWAFEGDADATQLVSNTCTIEWPPRSEIRLEIPEIDRGDWFGLEAARIKIRDDQQRLLDVLVATVGSSS
ncbi:MAG: NUDIX domain-containing protein [Bryocella sp.]